MTHRNIEATYCNIHTMYLNDRMASRPYPNTKLRTEKEKTQHKPIQSENAAKPYYYGLCRTFCSIQLSKTR